jgi:site-specific DNA-methyltransferase (adenine-specific)
MTATAGYPSKYSIRNPISGERKQRIRTDRVVAETGVRMNAWELPTGGTTPTKDRFTSEHPARMPEALARDLILSYSNPGDLVLDPMNGVGTTTKMARLNSRRYLGIEINPQWHEIAMRRMAETEIDYQRSLDEWLGGAA